MRIALVASVTAAVSPRAQGGVESTIAELGKMLTRLGHAVVVYASGDSRPECPLNWRIPRAIAGAPAERELRHLAYAWADIGARAQPFDVVHVHHAAALALRGDSRIPTVFTVHHDRDEALFEHYSEFPDVCFVATRDRQVTGMRELAFRAVVPSGLDPDDFPRTDAVGEYCAFVGDLIAENAPHVAVDAARLAGMPMKLGAPEHGTEQAYFAAELLPRLDAAADAVRWLGSLSDREREVLVQNARALLVTARGAVPRAAVEAMLSGTPVIALAGSETADLVDEGVTGFVVADAHAMAARLAKMDRFDRARCRAQAAERWSSLRMATLYEGLYAELLRARPPREAAARSRARAPSSPAARGGARAFNGLFSPLWEH